MGLPGREIIGAVHRDTAAFFLLFGLELAKPEELARITVNGKTTGVGIEEVAVGVIPASTRNNVLAGGGTDNGQCREDAANGHLGGLSELRSEACW